MAQPIQPFSGGGGYGNIMAPGYQQISQQVGDEYIARQNAKVDSAQQALNSIIGMGAKAGGADPLMAGKMLPSSINEYYAQSSELDKKSNAMKKMLELNPEMFGLDKDQVKQLGDVTSKMSSTERSAFFQSYVPDLFKAQQEKMQQSAALNRIVTGAFASKAAELAGTPTPAVPNAQPMIVPSQTGAGIVPQAPQSTQSPQKQSQGGWYDYQGKKLN